MDSTPFSTTFLVTTNLGCCSDHRPELTLSACVARGTFGNANMGNQAEYVVNFRIVNSGDVAVEFDEIVAAWVPRHGQPLVATTRQGRRGDQKDPTLPAVNSPGPLWSLIPGREYSQRSQSNGYTQFLLRDCGRSPLQLQIDIRIHNQLIVKTFIADLPRLEDLPAPDSSDGNMVNQGWPLEFRQVS